MMRIVLTLILTFAIAASAVRSAESVTEWLDRAADAQAGRREREYAARQVMMLADSSASILISAMRGEGSDSGLRRQVAARILAEMAVPGAEAALLEAAFGDEYFLAEAAKAGLARFYSRLPDNEIYSLLRHGGRERNAIPGGDLPGAEDWLSLSLMRADARSRFKALVMRGLALKYAGTVELLPEPLAWCVWDALLDTDRELRLAAVSVVPRIANSLATEKLAAFLYTENEPRLLAAALQAMAEMRPPEYGAAVERHVPHADPMVSLEALAALSAMGYPGLLLPGVTGVRTVSEFARHPSTPVRRRALEILAESRSPAVVEHIAVVLQDNVSVNRAAAARILGELGFTGAIGLLSPLMGDRRPEVWGEAAVALSRLGVLGVAAGVSDRLRDKESPFRRAAAEALGHIGDARAVPALVETLGDPDSELACLAAEALGRLGEKSAGVAIFEVMSGNECDPVLAEASRGALTEIFLDDPGGDPAAWPAWGERNGISIGLTTK